MNHGLVSAYRNYQARSLAQRCRSAKVVYTELVGCPEPGIAGIAQVSAAAYPDASQFDKKSPYFDGEAKRESRAVQRRRAVRPQDPAGRPRELRGHRELSKMRTLARATGFPSPGERDEWEFITRRLMKV